MNAQATEVGAEAEVEQPKPTKAKTKVAKEKTDDVLVAMVQEISKLSATDAIAMVPNLLNGADENYFRLGGVLSAISTNKFYLADGYDNFKTFVEDKYGIQYRKAMYWVQIYDKLIESGVSWNKVKSVGWTKLKDLVAVLTNDNVDDWITLANKSTTLQLQAAIAKAKTGTLATSGITPTEDTPAPEKQVTTFTVKVHNDQKTVINEAIEKALLEANTEFPGVALEAICMNYLSGGNVGKPAPLLQTLEQHSPEEVLSAMETAFPNFEITAKLKSK